MDGCRQTQDIRSEGKIIRSTLKYIMRTVPFFACSILLRAPILQQ